MKNIKYENIIIIFIIFASLFPFIIQNWYFLSIDFIYADKINFIDWQYYQNNILYIYLQKVISFLLPTFIVQKLLFLWFFWVWFLSIQKLLNYEFNNNRFLVFIWTLFFLINPFVYPRLLQWQIYILYAYALLPLIFYFLFKHKYLYFFIITAIIISLSPHFIFIIWIISIFYTIFYFKNIYENIKLKEIVFWILFIVLLNIYWIIDIKNLINNFSIIDVSYFKSNIIYFKNIYLEILSLNWFWWDKNKRYIIDNSYIIIYILSIFFISIIWIFSLIKNKKTIFFITIFFTSFILSIWISENNIFKSFNEFLYKNIPFYIWLREVNKFSSIMVLCYIYFILNWLKFFVEIKKNNYLYLISILFLINTITINQIFKWQIKAVNYPKEWYYIRDFLENNNYENICHNKNCYNNIVFPRHQSIYLNFTKKIVVNPAWLFFWENTLVWDNIEAWKIYSQSNRSESKIIEKYVWPKWLFKSSKVTLEAQKQFILDLKSLKIDYIILLKESDFYNYSYFLDILWKNWLIYREKENNNIRLYKIY